MVSPFPTLTRNSSGDEIANMNFLYDDIVHVLQNTRDSCINSATDRRGYVLERMFTKFSEITQYNATVSFGLHQARRARRRLQRFPWPVAASGTISRLSPPDVDHLSAALTFNVFFRNRSLPFSRSSHS